MRAAEKRLIHCKDEPRGDRQSAGYEAEIEPAKIAVSLIDPLYVTKHPGRVEILALWSVQTKQEEEVFAGRNPVGLFAIRGFGSEVDVVGTIGICLHRCSVSGGEPYSRDVANKALCFHAVNDDRPEILCRRVGRYIQSIRRFAVQQLAIGVVETGQVERTSAEVFRQVGNPEITTTRTVVNEYLVFGLIRKTSLRLARREVPDGPLRYQRTVRFLPQRHGSFARRDKEILHRCVCKLKPFVHRALLALTRLERLALFYSEVFQQ